MNSKFDSDYPIKIPCKLQVLYKPFFSPEEKKDEWIYGGLPSSEIFRFSSEITENMVVHLAGFLTPLFGQKTLRIQEDFPDALYEDMNNHTKIRVEFEKNTSSFLEHNHPPSGCDAILCWEDNLTQKKKEEHLFSKNPNLKIVEFKKIFFHYDFELSIANKKISMPSKEANDA